MSDKWKTLLLKILLPAVIVGLFSISPFLYGVITAPKSELLYTITLSPEIKVQDGYRRIVSLAVVNSGKLSLSGIRAIINLEDAEIEAYAVENESGINPRDTVKDSSFIIDVEKMLPNEQFVATSMVLFKKTDSVPVIVIRSNEVLGILKDTGPDEKNQIPTWIATLVVTIAAMVTIVSTLRNRSLGTNEKQDTLFYIPVKLGLNNINREMRLIRTDLSYLRMADIFLAHGLDASLPERQNIVKALKCLLLVKDIADTSLSVITNNIKSLEGENYSDEEISLLRKNAVDIDKTLELRGQIDKVIRGD